MVICRKFFHTFIVVYYLPVGFLSPSLSAQLIPLGLLEAGRISIVLIIHSLDRRGTLSPSLFTQLIAPYNCTFQTGSQPNLLDSSLLGLLPYQHLACCNEFSRPEGVKIEPTGD